MTRSSCKWSVIGVAMAALCLAYWPVAGRAQNLRIRICVPDSAYEDCLQMSDNIPGTFSCINARDKFECMQLVDRDEADVVNVDAEDLYLGGRLYELEPFAREEHNGNLWLGRTAVVVPRTSRIQTVQDLRNRRACLGPYQNLFQWNIPVGILLASETMVPDCRGELATVQRFFGEACAAGDWSADDYLDQELKHRHRRLCTLCKDTAFGLCTEGDMFAGPEGSLKCLVEGRGEVAFTTMQAALSYFDRRPADRHNFELLCLDGSRMAITGRGCHWAQQPTNAFLIRRGRDRQKEIYLRTLQQVFMRFVKLRPSWLYRTLVSSANVTQLVSVPGSQARYDRYLEFYLPSIEKPLQGCARRNLSFCLHRPGELAKCQQLQKAAFARRIRPTIRCYQADSELSCLRLLNQRKVDLAVLPPDRFYYAARYHSLQALALEVTERPRYGVAVVRATAAGDLPTLASLRGKRSCHGRFGDLAGWVIPIGVLIADRLVEPMWQPEYGHGCNQAHLVVQYFSGGSCVPGAADARINPNGTGVAQLCQQCVGDDRGMHQCDLDAGERYSGEQGALRCLWEGRGDVAFLSHDTVLRLAGDGRFPAPWAAELKSSDLRLLCRLPADTFDPRTGGFHNPAADLIDGGSGSDAMLRRALLQATVYDYERCHLAAMPDRVVATSAFTPLDVRLEVLLMLSQLSDAFLGRHRDSFRLAGGGGGTFANRSTNGAIADALFSDQAHSIRLLGPDPSLEETLGPLLPFMRQNDPVACGAPSLHIAVAIIYLSIVFHFHII